jgi:hypothetical protein
MTRQAIANIAIIALRRCFRFRVWNWSARAWLIEWAYGPQRPFMWSLD